MLTRMIKRMVTTSSLIVVTMHNILKYRGVEVYSYNLHLTTCRSKTMIVSVIVGVGAVV